MGPVILHKEDKFLAMHCQKRGIIYNKKLTNKKKLQKKKKKKRFLVIDVNISDNF